MLTRSMKQMQIQKTQLHKPRTTPAPKQKDEAYWLDLIPSAKEIAISFSYYIHNEPYSVHFTPSLQDINEVNLILHELVTGIKNHGIPDVTEITNTRKNVKLILKSKGFQVTEYINNGMYKCFVGLP